MATDHSAGVPEGDRDPAQGEQADDPGRAAGLQLQRIERYQAGPLPPPDEFARYESVVAGAAERILVMAEQEQAHRHEVNRRQIDLAQSQQRLASTHVSRGQLFGLIVSLAAIIGGAVIAVVASIHQSAWGAAAGGVIGAGGLASVILAFLGQRSEQAKGDDENQQ